jgi:hypothetical protein
MQSNYFDYQAKKYPCGYRERSWEIGAIALNYL